MTDFQFESGCKHMTTAKSDSDCYFYQLLLVIGCPILLGGLKIGDKVHDKLGLGDIFVGKDTDRVFILDGRSKC